MKKKIIGIRTLGILGLIAALMLAGCGRKGGETAPGPDVNTEKAQLAEPKEENSREKDTETGENTEDWEQKESASYPRKLQRGELQAFTNWIDQEDNSGNYGLLLSEYTDPKDADLNQIFYTGAGMESESLTDSEKQAYLKLTGLSEIYTDMTRLTTGQINDFLEEKLGCTLDEMTAPFNWTYLEETDAWVNQHGDTNYTLFTCVGGQETEKGIYELECVPGGWENGVSVCPPSRLTLARHGDGYRVLSNVYDESIQDSKDIWKIDDQSFDTDLGGSCGQVTFTSYAPNTNVYSTQDVSFALVKNGETVYEFPNVMEGNFRSRETFLKILAISFQDYNGDGEKDVIVICEYAPIVNTASGGTLKEVRLYRNMGDNFQLDRDKMDWLQVNDYCNTIDQVMEHVKEAAANE